MADYAELHCHTSFSFLDGASAPDELAERAAELGLAGLAITDHQGLYGVVRGQAAYEEAGLRPVLGIEVELRDAIAPDPERVVPARRVVRRVRQPREPCVPSGSSRRHDGAGRSRHLRQSAGSRRFRGGRGRGGEERLPVPGPRRYVMGSLVELRDVTREYRMGEVTVQALRGVDLEIDAGQVVVLLGPSGSGKTTLLNLVGGLDSPTAGDVVIAGEAIAGYDARRLADYRARTVGFIFQFFNLIPSLTAVENVERGRGQTAAMNRNWPFDIGHSAAVSARACSARRRNCGVIRGIAARIFSGEPSLKSVANSSSESPVADFGFPGNRLPSETSSGKSVTKT